MLFIVLQCLSEKRAQHDGRRQLTFPRESRELPAKGAVWLLRRELERLTWRNTRTTLPTNSIFKASLLRASKTEGTGIINKSLVMPPPLFPRQARKPQLLARYSGRQP